MKTNLDTLEHSPVDNSVAHTPGPWAITSEFDGMPEVYIIWGADEWPIAQLDGYRSSGANPNAEADARLIAASPDLLIAVESLLEELHRTRKLDIKKDYSLMVDIEACRKAIRKAKGD